MRLLTIGWMDQAGRAEVNGPQPSSRAVWLLRLNHPSVYVFLVRREARNVRRFGVCNVVRHSKYSLFENEKATEAVAV